MKTDVNKNLKDIKKFEMLEKRQKLAKYKKKLKIIFVLLIIAVSIICTMNSCSFENNTQHNPPKQKRVQELKYKTFITQWNQAIDKLKYKCISQKEKDRYKFDTTKGIIYDKEVVRKINDLLTFDKEYLSALEQKLKNSRFHTRYMPIIDWIKEKKMVKSIINQNFKSKMSFEDSIVKSLNNTQKYYSNNTIYKIIQLNNFCFYFKKNKNKFYRNGFSENIKDCEGIRVYLKQDKIKYYKIIKCRKSHK